VTTPEIRLYDSFRREKVPFVPLEPGKVKMYVCGPTPYAPAHIGHAYSAAAFDTLRRSLRYLGYQVTYVRNITDVEDKVFAAAAKLGEDPLALAERYAVEYRRDMGMFGVMLPDIEPYVSTHIDAIIAITQRLIDGGSAYAVDGDVYFEVKTFPAYGHLSGQTPDELRAGARVEVDERKRAPADFALWKSAKPGEPSWDSPWGKGRPGWHIECSAMCVEHLGVTFDLHGGGRDLIFPHHENEIAQSQGAYGEGTFARYWLHNGFLTFEGEKMARSVGNVFGCQPIADAAGAEAVRFFFSSHHYRAPVEFEYEVLERDADQRPTKLRFTSLESADRRLSYFYETLERVDAFVAQGDGGDGGALPETDKLVAAATEALADDFNTPVVVAALYEAAKLANKLLDEGKGIDKQLRRRSIARLGRDLRAVGGALGLFEQAPRDYLTARRGRLVARRGIDVARVQALLGERDAARKGKDFARADAIRGELLALGVEVLDTPTGTDWRVADSV
jgi:cysteinyl-tRNA synthetase